MKKLLTILLTISICMAFGIPAYAIDDSTKNTMEISSEYAYYDEQLQAKIIAFTVDENQSVNYLTKSEVEEIDEMSMPLPTEKKSVQQVMLRDNYRQWYTFTKTSGPTKYVGAKKKVSADFVAPNAGGSISKNISFTQSQTFSASVTSSSQKSAIQAGCGFSWVKSATTGTTYTVKLKRGESGYLSFSPYYKKVVGKLKLYTNWDGLISTTDATGYSVMKTSDGEPDGLYKFIYY